MSDGAYVTAMACAEKRHLIVVSTSDSLLISVSFAPDMKDEFLLVGYSEVAVPQVSTESSQFNYHMTAAIS